MNPTIARLRDAMNAHDPEGMAAVMAPGYRSEQPVHPHRAFVGNRQVVANWTEMFHGVPDLSVGWLEHELERCDYRRAIARAIAAHDPDGAAAAAHDALAPAAEMLSAVAQSPKRAASRRK